MGLFTDYSGIPLAICINRGNKNEQQTLVPLEEKLLQDFELAKFIFCTDAGLASEANRKFNNFSERSFVTTVSVKMMAEQLQKWCLDPGEWHLEGDKKGYNIDHLEDNEEGQKKNYGKTFYKQKYIEGYDEERDIQFNQTLIVTYSLNEETIAAEEKFDGFYAVETNLDDDVMISSRSTMGDGKSKNRYR